MYIYIYTRLLTQNKKGNKQQFCKNQAHHLIKQVMKIQMLNMLK